MPHLTRDGVKLFYQEAGRGPAIVFVHGWCCDHTHFERQFEYFSARHRILSLDLRGHGESDKPTEDYTMPLFADDVAFVCRELGIKDMVAVGPSWAAVSWRPWRRVIPRLCGQAWASIRP